MGIWTLANFRDDLQRAIGNRGPSNAWLNRRINSAYEEVCGAIEFKGLETTTTITTVDGTASYSLPAALVGVLSVVDDTNDLILLRLDYSDYGSKNPDTDAEGDPTHWARSGGNLYLWPTPGTDDYSIIVAYTARPTQMSTSSSVTEIPSTWDLAVHMLAVHHALLNLGGNETDIIRANSIGQRAFAYIRSRITDRGRDKQSISAGLEVAHSLADLTDQAT